MASLREVGQRLKQAREAQGLSLDEVAARTRVTVRHLLAIEEGNETDLPEVFYIRGFLKKYAEAVGLSPNDVADAYRQAPTPAAHHAERGPGLGPIGYYLAIAILLGGAVALAWHFQPRVSVDDGTVPSSSPSVAPSVAASPSPEPSPAASASPAASPSADAAATAAASAAVPPASSPPSAEATASVAPSPAASAAPSGSPAAAASAAASVAPSAPASAAARPTPSLKPTARPTPRPTPTGRAATGPSTAPSARPTVPPAPTAAPSAAATLSPTLTPESVAPASPAVSAKPSPSPKPTKVSLSFTLVERSWVEVIVDGRRVFEGLLPRGAEKRYSGKAIELSAGNAGGVRVNVNGRDLGRMGVHGVVETRTYRP